MQALSKSDEQQLLDGVKQAVDLVDNMGMTPNAAMRQVAEQLHYSPGFLKAACNAFNTGRQLAQWDANDSVLDKLASFPLADYAAVHDAMWGTSQEKVAQISYSTPRFLTYEDQVRQELLATNLATFTKAASADTEVSPLVAEEQAQNRVKRAYAAVDYHKRLVESARSEQRDANDKLKQGFLEVERYFRKSAYDRLPFAQVEHAVVEYYGQHGKSLMNGMAELFPQEKRAADQPAGWVGFAAPMDRTKAPYPMVADVLQKVQQLKQANAKLADATTKLAAAQGEYDALLRNALPEAPQSYEPLNNLLIPDNTKQANFTSGMAGGLGLGFAENLAESVKADNPKRVEDQIKSLESPEHINELRKIRAQTVLTQLMSDPENPLSGYDPEEVLSAYNQMVQLSPRLADQPAAIGPMLSKRLAGNTEPFEIGETLKLEKGLKDTQSSPAYQMDLMRHDSSLIR